MKTAIVFAMILAVGFPASAACQTASEATDDSTTVPSANAVPPPAAGATTVPPADSANVPTADTVTASSAGLGARFTPGPDYVIGIGDVLRVFVWKEPELSGSAQVRSDGKISLPLLADVPAIGFKPMDLAASITQKLKKYVDDPRVTVIPTSIRAPVIYMVGETGHSGPMPLAPNMTIMQALMTSGLSTFANAKKIYVLRSVNGVQQKFRVNYKRLIKGKMLNENIVLKPGDIVVVP
jgi:polysaccharide export outer membrane protein